MARWKCRSKPGNMAAMIRRLTPALAGLVALAAGALAVPATAAAGKARARSKESYVFLVSRVDLKKGVPAEVSRQVATRLRAAIDAHEALEKTIPEGAPDPEAAPEKFKTYLRARHKRAYKMNVEVTSYSQEVEPAPKPNSQYVTVRLSLRLFAETYPGRSMAIHGDGSATVKIEVGKTIRPRDREEANSAALDQAVAGAIEELLVKLREPPRTQKKKSRKRATRKK